MDVLLEVRDFLNEGGRVMYAGELAGAQHTTVLGTLGQYDPTAANARCSQLPAGTDPRRCLFAFGSTSSDLVNDVIEYWFGAYIYNWAPGLDRRHLPGHRDRRPVHRVRLGPDGG